MEDKVNSLEYYSNYKGHLIEHLTTLKNYFDQQNPRQKYIYLGKKKKKRKEKKI